MRRQSQLYLAEPLTVSLAVIISPHLIFSWPRAMVSRLAPLKKSMNSSFSAEMFGGSSRNTPIEHWLALFRIFSFVTVLTKPMSCIPVTNEIYIYIFLQHCQLRNLGCKEKKMLRTKRRKIVDIIHSKRKVTQMLKCYLKCYRHFYVPITVNT